MSNYHKTFWGSVLAFFVGTSCCWLSALGIWLGGAALIGTLANFIADLQLFLLALALLLAGLTVFFYLKKR